MLRIIRGVRHWLQPSAAEQSNRQWKEQASFDIYVPKAAKVKTKLMWVHGSVMQVANTNFQFVHHPEPFTVELFLEAVNGEFTPNNERQFKRYINTIESNNKYIKEHLLDSLYLLDETFILSKDYCSFSSSEIKTIKSVIRELIQHLRVISFTFEEVVSNDTNETSIDACFKCHDSSQHYIKSYESRYKLVDAFLEMIVSSRDVEAWEEAKGAYIECQKESASLFAKENPELQESLNKHYEGLFG
ncbi:hypothetical protein [Vibrio europaeus]|uniref:hypothetical protein n=1 Tax=Vibrio europaeus TaxID=300876 RepID=UPI00233EB6A9|nr:hypothetical protein [Vibrio europaeus]MDC5857425.1 hypothetical protein [Vibrio europaeus]